MHKGDTEDDNKNNNNNNNNKLTVASDGVFIQFYFIIIAFPDVSVKTKSFKSVGLLRIGQGCSVCCKTVYRWVTGLLLFIGGLLGYCCLSVGYYELLFPDRCIFFPVI